MLNTFLERRRASAAQPDSQPERPRGRKGSAGPPPPPSGPLSACQTATLSECAGLLRLSCRTIQRLRASRKFPPPDIVVGGTSPRWRISTLEAFLRAKGDVEAMEVPS